MVDVFIILLNLIEVSYIFFNEKKCYVMHIYNSKTYYISSNVFKYKI